MAQALTDELFSTVTAMNRDNFIVRQHIKAVEHFQERSHWQQLTDEDYLVLHRELANCPARRKPMILSHACSI
ncbi:MAG: hypothetical protein R3E89_00320 [Thiolinea sp.]